MVRCQKRGVEVGKNKTEGLIELFVSVNLKPKPYRRTYTKENYVMYAKLPKRNIRIALPAFSARPEKS